MDIDKRIRQPLADHADEPLNADTHLRHGWMNVFLCVIGPLWYSMVSFVTLSEAKGLSAPLDCQPERSGGSVSRGRQMLRFAQHDSLCHPERSEGSVLARREGSPDCH